MADPKPDVTDRGGIRIERAERFTITVAGSGASLVTTTAQAQEILTQLAWHLRPDNDARRQPQRSGPPRRT